MTIEITKAHTFNEVALISQLAREIWRQHFTAIIGANQVEYMLEKFQSEGAISSQIEKGMEYYLARLNNDALGYVALAPDPDAGKMMLGKLYVRERARGSGAGTSILEYVETRCKSDGFLRLWLTVNRFNSAPISWYKKRGFVITDEVKKDIGNGFFMDDYIMEKNLS